MLKSHHMYISIYYEILEQICWKYTCDFYHKGNWYELLKMKKIY